MTWHCKQLKKTHNDTYARAIYQFLDANIAAASKRARPTSVMVGAVANGPIYRSNRPISPLTPSTISNNEATIIAPCICHQHKIPAEVIMRPSLHVHSFKLWFIHRQYHRRHRVTRPWRHIAVSITLSVCYA